MGVSVRRGAGWLRGARLQVRGREPDCPPRLARPAHCPLQAFPHAGVESLHAQNPAAQSPTPGAPLHRRDRRAPADRPTSEPRGAKFRLCGLPPGDGPQRQHQRSTEFWTLVRNQHGVVARWQLLALGWSRRAIEHGIAKGRLHRIHQGVYAVGRPLIGQHAEWIGAVLVCGPAAVLSHSNAASLWRIRGVERGRAIDVSTPAATFHQRRGIRVHRRAALTGADLTRRHGIPVTGPICTLIDLATELARDQLEAAVNEADKLGLTDPERLRVALDRTRPRPGVGVIRDTLDRRTFTMTDSGLERLFLPIARRAGMRRLQTQVVLNGYTVDFYDSELGVVIETDGLRYHRTPSQQAADRLRDQAHTAAGLILLRFTTAQVRYDPLHVERVVTAVVRRLEADRRGR